jgi:hypothetical protein
MSNYIITAVEIVKVLGLEPTDANIIKYLNIVKNRANAEKALDLWSEYFGEETNANSSDN